MSREGGVRPDTRGTAGTIGTFFPQLGLNDPRTPLGFRGRLPAGSRYGATARNRFLEPSLPPQKMQKEKAKTKEETKEEAKTKEATKTKEGTKTKEAAKTKEESSLAQRNAPHRKKNI